MIREKDKSQRGLFGMDLESGLDSNHSLYKLANKVNWEYFTSKFGVHYSDETGRPAKSIRLLVGLHYLKSIYGESDENVVKKWVENPYWQYFCGEKEFQHELPLEPTTLVKWRNRIRSEGIESLLKESIRLGLEVKLLKKNDIKKVNIDTTVQEKAITYPMDAKLYYKMLSRLVKDAKEFGINLRQSYVRKSKNSLFKQSMYRRCRQMRRAAKEVKKLKIYLGRVKRDIERKTSGKIIDIVLQADLNMAERLLNQKRTDKNKLYSLHAPEVECIAKGKAHKKYEFGCKVGVVTSSRANYILGVKAYHGNPYDGHTLEDSIKQTKKMIGNIKIEDAYVDKGYRGQEKEIEGVKINIAKKGIKKLKQGMRKWMKRRSAIEPIIGHMKNDNGKTRNHLLGKEGDKMNAILMASGFNMRKLLKAFFLSIFRINIFRDKLRFQINFT